MSARAINAVLVTLLILSLANGLMFLALTGGTAFAVEQAKSPDSPVYTGVGAPKAFDPVSVGTGGSTEVGNGTNALVFPWGAVVNISCPSLIGTANTVLMCASMNLAATVDVSNGQIDDGTRNDNGHCRWLDGARPAVDMRLERRRLYDSLTPLPGFIGLMDTIGYCNSGAGVTFRGAPCLVASQATDCGGSFCTVHTVNNLGGGPSDVSRNLAAIAGVWLQGDATAATTCNIDADI